MRLVYLSNAELPSRAANGVHIMRMCAAFAAAGHEVTLVAPRNADPSSASPGAVFEFYGVPRSFAIVRPRRGRGALGEYLYAVKCLRVVRRIRPDRVFSRYLLGSVAASLSGVPGGLELHQPVPDSSRLQRRLFRWYLQRREFRRLVVITSPLREIFHAAGLPEDRILVAPDGADLPAVGVQPWKPGSDRMQVGYLGHLYRGRGVDLIIDLAQRCPWADFHVVGGMDTDIARVQRESENTPNVTVHGFVPPARAEEMRLGLDVLLAPYQQVVGLGSGGLTTERWMSPLKIFEYMAAGKPIVCSDLPILRDVLTPDRNALLCAPDRVEEWRAALERLRDAPDLCDALGSAARADVVDGYQWSTRAEHIVAALGDDRR